MAELRIADLVTGGNDASGAAIREIYTKHSPEYAIYRTATRVLIDYADDPAREAQQRTAIAPLGPLRSEINGLIDGWRSSTNHRKLANARQYDRRTADGLVLALESDMAGAEVELNAVRNEIMQARTATARFLYLAVALAVATLFWIIVYAASSRAVGLCAAWTGVEDVLIAIVGGAGGAFFSIAINLSDRGMLPDLQWRDNTIDAILRVVIGVVSAAVIICLLKSGLVSLTGDAGGDQVADTATAAGWMRLITIGFLAGFSERLVPDLLAKASAGMEAGKAATPAPAKPDMPPKHGDPAPAKVGGSAAPPPDGNGDCCSDSPLADADATADAALPAATGGTK